MPPTDLAQAHDPATAASRLSALASHEDEAVRLAVAANPSTSRRTVDAMLTASSEQGREARRSLVESVLGNPSLSLWLLDEPAWLEDLDWAASMAMAMSPSLTPLVWEAMKGHFAGVTRAFLLRSPVAPPDAWRRLGFASEIDGLLELIAHDEDPIVQRVAITDFMEHIGIPYALENDPGWFDGIYEEAALALARSPELTPLVWQALHRFDKVSVRVALLCSPVAPPDAWAQLGLPAGGAWDLSNRELEVVDIVSLAARPELAALTGLDLSDNDSLGDEGIAALAGSSFVTGLTTLTLGGCGVSERGLQALARSPSLRDLTSLDLSLRRLGETVPASLAPLASLAQLTDLDLSRHSLHGDRLLALTSCGGFASLRSLRLSRCQLTVQDLVTLSRWPVLARLTSLDLSRNNLPDEARGVLLAVTARVPGLVLRW